MAVAGTTSSVPYTGNGSTTSFPIPFKFIDYADLVVTYTPSGGSPVVWIRGTNYTVTGAGVDGGGTLTAIAAPAAASSLVIARATGKTQGTVFTQQGSFLPESVEDALDKLTLIAQDFENSVATTVSDDLEPQYTALAARVTAIESTLNTVSGGSFATQLNLITQLQRQLALSAALAFLPATAAAAILSAAELGFAQNTNPRLGPLVMGAAAGALYVGDGNQWLSRTSNITGDITSIASSGSVVVVAGTLIAAVPVIASSTDASTWTAQSNSGTQHIRGCVWASAISKFVTIGESGETMTSTNGATWTSPVATGTGTGWRITYGNGLLIAYKQSSTTFYTSTNGTSWTVRTAPGAFTGSDGVPMAYFPAAAKWLFFCGTTLYTSPDGFTLTTAGITVSSPTQVQVAVTRGSTPFAMLLVKALSNYRWFTTFDAVTFTERDVPLSALGISRLIPLAGGGVFALCGGDTANAISAPLFTP